MNTDPDLLSLRPTFLELDQPLDQRRINLEALCEWLENVRVTDRRNAPTVLLSIARALLTPSYRKSDCIPFKAFRDDAFPPTNSDPAPVEALEKKVKLDVIHRWWDDNFEDYLSSIPEGAQPLTFHLDRARPAKYGFKPSDDVATSVTPASEITYKRSLIPDRDVFPPYRILIQDSGIDLGSWRGWLIKGPQLAAIFWITVSAILSVFALLNAPLSQTAALIICWMLASSAIWFFKIKPFLDLFDHRLTLMSDSDMWLYPSADPGQFELKRSEIGGPSRIDLVRYEAKCPACSHPVRLAKGRKTSGDYIIGKCIEHPDDHIFTFDRHKRQGKRITR